MSIERRGRKWRVRWREGGKARSQTFDRKRDAELLEAELIRGRQLGSLKHAIGGRETLNHYFDNSWEPRAKTRLSERTHEDYLYFFNSIVRPVLGGYRLEELGVEAIANWQAAALKNRGAGSVHQANKVLAAVLQEAFVAGRIAQNPARRVLKPKVPHREIPPMPSPADIEKMREASRHASRWTELGDRDALMISLLAYAGLRPEEIRGLRWGDVRDNSILVQRVLVKAGFRPTKTRQRRAVRLLDALKDDLGQARNALGHEPDPNEQVIKGRSGKPVSLFGYQSWVRRSFRRAAEAAGLPSLIPYDLRHAFVSLLVHEGRSVIYVASQLGHDPRLTLDTYGHVIIELEDQPQLSANDAIRLAREERTNDGQLKLPGIDDEP